MVVAGRPTNNQGAAFIHQALHVLRHADPKDLDFDLGRVQSARLANITQSVDELSSREIRFEALLPNDLSILLMQRLNNDDPLIPYNSFISAISQCPSNPAPFLIVKAVAKAVLGSEGSQCNLEVLGELLHFLQSLTQSHDTRILAVAFAPVLFRKSNRIPNDSSGTDTKQRINGTTKQEQGNAMPQEDGIDIVLATQVLIDFAYLFPETMVEPDEELGLADYRRAMYHSSNSSGNCSVASSEACDDQLGMDEDVDSYNRPGLTGCLTGIIRKKKHVRQVSRESVSAQKVKAQQQHQLHRSSGKSAHVPKRQETLRSHRRNLASLAYRSSKLGRRATAPPRFRNESYVLSRRDSLGSANHTFSMHFENPLFQQNDKVGSRHPPFLKLPNASRTRSAPWGSVTPSSYVSQQVRRRSFTGKVARPVSSYDRLTRPATSRISGSLSSVGEQNSNSASRYDNPSDAKRVVESRLVGLRQETVGTLSRSRSAKLTSSSTSSKIEKAIIEDDQVPKLRSSSKVSKPNVSSSQIESATIEEDQVPKLRSSSKISRPILSTSNSRRRFSVSFQLPQLKFPIRRKSHKPKIKSKKRPGNNPRSTSVIFAESDQGQQYDPSLGATSTGQSPAGGTKSSNAKMFVDTSIALSEAPKTGAQKSPKGSNTSPRNNRASLPPAMPSERSPRIGSRIERRDGGIMMWPWTYSAYKRIVLAGIRAVASPDEQAQAQWPSTNQYRRRANSLVRNRTARRASDEANCGVNREYGHKSHSHSELYHSLVNIESSAAQQQDPSNAAFLRLSGNAHHYRHHHHHHKLRKPTVVARPSPPDVLEDNFAKQFEAKHIGTYKMERSTIGGVRRKTAKSRKSSRKQRHVRLGGNSVPVMGRKKLTSMVRRSHQTSKVAQISNVGPIFHKSSKLQHDTQSVEPPQGTTMRKTSSDDLEIDDEQSSIAVIEPNNEDEDFHDYLLEKLADRYLEQVEQLKDRLLLLKTFDAWRVYRNLCKPPSSDQYVWSVDVRGAQERFLAERAANSKQLLVDGSHTGNTAGTTDSNRTFVVTTVKGTARASRWLD